MNSLRLRPGGVPLLACPAFLAWYVDGDGVIRAVDGTAGDGYSERIEGTLGLNFRVALAGEPGCVRRIERALAGEPVAEVGEAWGANWYHVVVPSKCGWGVDGWSTLLPEGVAAAEPDGRDDPRRRTWELVGLPRAAHETYRDGDFFIKVEGLSGVAMGRRITDAEFLALHMEHGAAMQLTEDSSRACPSRPRLRLLPP